MHVFIVEEPSEAAAKTLDLERLGHSVDVFRTGAELMAAHHHDAELVLLDLDLPDTDGIELCREIRRACDTPIIAIARGGSELDRVLALQAGADDCIDKNIGRRELVARIEAILRRVAPHRRSAQAIDLSPLQIEADTRKVFLAGEPVELTAKEFDLLLILAQNLGNTLSRRELMASVWGTNWPIPSRTIDTHVRSLRRKLRSNDWIITIRGVGYQMGRHHPGHAAAAIPQGAGTAVAEPVAPIAS